MTNKTVVAWNATPEAEAALHWATARESQRRGTIALVFIVEDRSDVQQQNEASAAIRDAAARTRAAAPGCTVTTTIGYGEPRDVLVEYTNEDWVLAVGARARTTARPRATGSTASRLAAASRGTVAVVPGSSTATGRDVLVGVDGSREAESAAEFAANEAERLAADLVLVHAWNEPALMEGQPSVDRRFLDALSDESTHLLSAARTDLLTRHPGLSIGIRSLHGEPDRALLHASLAAQELIVGSRGLRGLRRVLLGSVSRNLVERAGCPIVVVGAQPQPFSLQVREDVARALAEQDR